MMKPGARVTPNVTEQHLMYEVRPVYEEGMPRVVDLLGPRSSHVPPSEARHLVTLSEEYALRSQGLHPA